MQPLQNSLWQKVGYFIAHNTNLWLTLVLLAAAFAAWRLTVAFAPSPDKKREFLFSRRVMFLHTGLAGFLWLANWLLS
jgi:hypothetical protein